MNKLHETTLYRLIAVAQGADAASRLFAILRIAPDLLEIEEEVSPSVMAMALNMLLFADLLERVPSAAAYADRCRRERRQIVFDHGALRTVRFGNRPTGALPAGQDAFARILEPLGYHVAGVYPLHRLRMTGRAYCHRDLPEAIPQFFVSELHVERFDEDFAAAAERVFGTSRDPLDAATRHVLADLWSIGIVEFDRAAAALPVLAGAFDRHHDAPALADYEILRSRSAEAAWIATEGNAFNHATDRVADVEALAGTLRSEGWPVKPEIEVSASGRVRQTALRADTVQRGFRDADGSLVTEAVPGSFHEFITREFDPATGALDLAFDSGNATGIFAMTKAA